MGRGRLGKVRIFFVKKAPEEEFQAAFVIDGRNYSDPDDVRRDTLEAFDALENRRIIAESELLSIEHAPSLGLPTWPEFKQTLPSFEK